ncbi:MAG: hypothetical protein J5I65_02590 [Aridibacter famidurans]|nr:hypothetical protein [Aridibacter famidurans]
MKDGLIIIDKPAGWTSHDVVAKLRKILKTRKIGHTGTLDPFATGVLVMLVGKATRLARFLHSDEKEYEAVMRFGFETDTGDATGEPRRYDRLQPVESRYDRLQPVEDPQERPPAEDSPRSRAAQTEVHGTSGYDRLQPVEDPQERPPAEDSPRSRAAQTEVHGTSEYDRLQPVEDPQERPPAEDSPRSRAAQTEVHGTSRYDRLQPVEDPQERPPAEDSPRSRAAQTEVHGTSGYDRLQPVEDSDELPLAEDSPRSRAAQTEVHGTSGYDRLQPVEALSKDLIDAVLPDFLGEIEQVPPMYSAKKVGGKRLYRMAREGKEIEREPVKVIISEIECTGEIASGEGTKDFGLRVVCSAGTYVRTLAEDIGRRVGIGCHLAELRRTRAGRFSLESARTLEDLAEHDPSVIQLLPMSDAVAQLPSLTISRSEEEEVRHGRRISHAENLPEGGEIALLTSEGKLAAVGENDPKTGEISPKLVMI